MRKQQSGSASLLGTRCGYSLGPARETSMAASCTTSTTWRESIDEMLVRGGPALAWTRDGQHRDILVAAENGARRDGFGCLWRTDQKKDFMDKGSHMDSVGTS
jgi:endonuclease YncB( thermonuclease family)